MIGTVDTKGKGKEVLEASRSALEKAKRSASVDITGSEEYVQAYEVDPSESFVVFQLLALSHRSNTPHNVPHPSKPPTRTQAFGIRRTG